MSESVAKTAQVELKSGRVASPWFAADFAELGYDPARVAGL